MESLTLDIRGQICPSALLTALRAINTHQRALRSGAVEIVVLTDARDATHTIPEAATNMGYSAEVVPKAGHYAIRLGAA